MSYAFTSGKFIGTLSSGLAYPFTIAAWVKYTNHPAAYHSFVSLAATQDELPNSAYIRTDSTDGWITATSADSTPSFSSAQYESASPAEFDNTWFAVVGCFVSATSRKIYAGVTTKTDSSGTSRTLTANLDEITIGTDPAWSENFAGKIAEVAVWDVDLSATSADLSDYMDGSRPASLIDSTNLIAYYPLSVDDDTPADAGPNSGPTLAMSGTVDYDADHPTIASALTKYLKLLAHASAASATGVNGIVFASSAGIAGAEIGEFTNKSFEATLESGKAVLKVPVADFGGGALTTSDTPVALVRNSTKTTGIISCTVIEE